MAEPIDTTYFNWLCAKVRMNSGSHHFGLFRLLHETEFVWNIPMDRNRAADGKELREYFCTALGIRGGQAWLTEPCSIFEMLIGLADRASFQTGMPVREWFWIFMKNLKLEDFHRVTKNDEEAIHEILYTFVWRLYDECGDGGIFPLRKPCANDQRKVELWYQLAAYLDDQGI